MLKFTKAILSGQLPYSISKIDADQIAISFCTSFDMPVVTICPLHTYDPKQSYIQLFQPYLAPIAFRQRRSNTHEKLEKLT